MRGEILVDLHDAAAQVPAVSIAQLRRRGLGLLEGCVALGLFAGVSLASIHGDLNEARPGGPRRHLAFRTSLTTSVPAVACMTPSGKRTAPTRSARLAMCSRAAVPALSIVPVLLTNSAMPPGRRRAIERAMK